MIRLIVVKDRDYLTLRFYSYKIYGMGIERQRGYRRPLLGLAVVALALIAGSSTGRDRADAAGFLVDCANVKDSNGELIYPPVFNARPNEYSVAIGSDPPTRVGFNRKRQFVVEMLYGNAQSIPVVLFDRKFKTNVEVPADWSANGFAMVQQSFTGNAANGETLWGTGVQGQATAACK